uniref:Uncharacterized protein n=1 Tax=Plectus sambesii TaxID=2011161 RepID=A0A914W9D3_9BILA
MVDNGRQRALRREDNSQRARRANRGEVDGSGRAAAAAMAGLGTMASTVPSKRRVLKRIIDNSARSALTEQRSSPPRPPR